jgi:hypothetical protein
VTDWIALSGKAHAASRYYPRHGYAFAASTATAPVLLKELPLVVAEYVLAFSRENGAPVPVVLTSLDGENNLYVDSDGRWLSSYVPAGLRAFPFRLLPTAAGEHTLCLAADHLCEDEADGQRLFDDTGARAAGVAHALSLLQQCASDHGRTLAAAAALDAAGVMVPWPLRVEAPGAPDPTVLEGFWRIDQEALAALDDRAFLALRRDEALLLAHSQLLSTRQLTQLGRRAGLRAARRAMQQRKSGGPVDLEALFGGGDDELTFE